MPRNGSGTYSRAVSPYAYNTTIDQAAVNSEMTDIATALTDSLCKDGQTTPTATLPMGTFRHTGVGAAAARTDYARAAEVQDGSITHLTSVSGGDTITATAGLALGAYAAGQTFTFVAAAANTTAVTLNINSIGAKAVTKNGTTPLVAGDIVSGSIVRVTYDGTRFQLVPIRKQTYPGVEAGTRFVFVGDSKTDGPTDPTSYPSYFAALATSADLGTVYNLGVSGYTLANLISNYTANVKPYAPGQANNLTSIPTVLSVWIGANDLYQLISNGYTDANDYYADLLSYVTTAAADGFRIMLFTVDARGDHVDGTTEFYRQTVNAAIRHNTVATWIVDPETVFWDYSDTTWWNADMIHYVAAGYERLAKLVAQTLLAGGAPGDLNSPKVNKTNTWSKPQAFTGGEVYVSGAAGTTRGVHWMTGLVARFFAYLTATAESGSNVGSDFAIARYNDAGVALNTLALLWDRATGLLTISDRVKFTGGFGTGAPVTVTDATYTVLATDYALICNRAGTVTLTLPSAATYSGRIIRVRTITANTVVSAGSDVVPLAGGAAGTAILAATAGKWADLQSDGTNWQIMAGA